MEKALYAVDELSGFIMACAYVRPTGIHGLTPKSVKKKMKTPAFAAAVEPRRAARGRRGARRGLRRARRRSSSRPWRRTRTSSSSTAPKPRDPLRAPLVRQLPEGARDARPGRRADYERVELDLFAGETRTPEHFARNPDGRIPVLELDDGRVPGRVRRDPALPGRGHASTCRDDPVERARVHAWMFFEQNQVEANIGVARFLGAQRPRERRAGGVRRPAAARARRAGARSTAASAAAIRAAAPTPSPTSRSTATSTSPTTRACPLAEHRRRRPRGCSGSRPSPGSRRASRRCRRTRAGAPSRLAPPMADDLKIIVLEGDETGQELLEQAIRVLDPEVTGVEAELVHYDLSLENRRATDNAVVSEAAAAMREAGFGLKAATVTPEGKDDVGSPNRILREEVDGKVIIRTGPADPGRGRAGVRRALPDLGRADGGRGRLRRQAVARGRRGRRRRGRLPDREDHALDVPGGGRVRVPDRRADPGRGLRRAEVDGLPRLRGDAQGGARRGRRAPSRTSSTGRC